MPCFDRASSGRKSLSNQYSMIGIMFESRAIECTTAPSCYDSFRLTDTDYNPPALASNRLTVMHSKPRSLCERTCLFFSLIKRKGLN